MAIIHALCILVSLSILSACQDSILKSNIKINIKESQPRIDRVKVENDQLIVIGANLSKVTLAKIEGSTSHDFTIESRSANQLVLNAKSIVSFLVGKTLNLIVSNAHASATFPLSFELQNGQVTAAKLHHMNASTGDFLQFDGASWAPASISTNQVYVGTYDASTDTPNLSAGIAPAGTYYIVTTAGTQILSSVSMNFDVGDWVISDGTNWSRVAVGTNTVSNFKGRTGAVVPLSGDYSWSMLTNAAGKLTGSKLQEIADVDVTGIQDGDILFWNNSMSKWESGPQPSVSIPAGSISNTQIASGAVDSSKIVDGSITNVDIAAGAAIDQTKINGLTTALDNKEPKITAGTAAQYWSGTKSWQNLNPAVIGSTLTGFTSTTGAVTAADNIISAIGKLSGNIGTVAATQGNYVLNTGDSMSGPLAMGGNKITGLDDPTALQDAATKAYVDLKAGAASQWTTNGSDIHYNSGNVGIGTTTPSAKLTIAGDEQELLETISYGTIQGANWLQRRARGTSSAPQVVQDGDLIGGMIGTSFDGSQYRNAAEIRFYADGTQGNDDTPAEIVFRTRPAGGAIQTRMTMASSGNVGIGTNTPLDKLSVVGNVALTGNLRLKSSTANYVELRAPAGLGSTLTFNFPASYGSNNQVLTTDGAGNLSWAAPGSSVPSGTAGGDLSGTYPNPSITGLDATKIGAASVDNTEFSYLNGVTSSIQAQLNNTGNLVLSTPLSTYAGGTATPILTTDNIPQALGKLNAYISANQTAAVQVDGSSTMTSNLKMGNNLITGVASPSVATDAATKGYVDTQITNSTTWLKNVSDIYFNTGNVGIGTATPTAPLNVYNTAGEVIGLFEGNPTGLNQSATIRVLNSNVTAPAASNSDFASIRADTLDSGGNIRAVSILSLGLNYSGQYGSPGEAVLDASNFSSGLNILNRSATGDIRFSRNSTEHMRITQAGNVGIGTTSPGAKLEVANSATLLTNGTGANTYFRNTSSANGDYLAIGWLGEDNWGIMSADSSTHRNLIFQATGGRVGVGTMTPASTMEIKRSDVNGAGPASPLILSSDASTPDDGATVSFYNLDSAGNAQPYGWMGSVIEDSTNGSEDGGLRFATTANGLNSEKVRISASGYVGIGTTLPGDLLEITGSQTLGLTIRGESTSSLRLIGNVAAHPVTGNPGARIIGPVNRDVIIELNGNGPTDHFSIMTDPSNGGLADTEAFVVANTGNVGIGITPAYKLDVGGDVNIAAANRLRFGGTQVCTSAGCTSSSDRRLKKNIHPLQDSLLKITQLQGVEYDYIDQKKFGDKHQVGVIAQDVEKVFPEVVITDKKSGLKSVAYDHLVAPIIEAIKSLYQSIIGIEKHNSAQDRKIASLESENAKLKQDNETVKEENLAIKAYICQKDPRAAFCK